MINILCVIVLYKQVLYQTNSYIECLQYLHTNKDIGIFVYDNSPYPMHTSEEMRKKGIIYKHDSKNSGISKAYNEAALYGKEKGYNWLLLLDQDTHFPNNSYLSIIKKHINAYSHIKLFAPIVETKNKNQISPFYSFHHFPYIRKTLGEKEYSTKKIGLINSGLVINIDTFFKVGGYNEKIFLDLSDYFFIDKFKIYQKRFFLLDYKLTQEFSGEEKNIEKQKNRFCLYCKCAKEYSKTSTINKIDFFLITLKKTCGFIIRFKDLSFWNIFLNFYIKNE